MEIFIRLHLKLLPFIYCKLRKTRYRFIKIFLNIIAIMFLNGIGRKMKELGGKSTVISCSSWNWDDKDEI